MATTSTNVYWSKDYAPTASNILLTTSYSDTIYQPKKMLDFTTTPDPPHECKTVQRLSQAYRNLVREGVI